MDKINHCWPFIVIIVIMFLFFLFFDFLRRKDMKIDYTNKRIRYYIENNNGVDYIIIPYLFWQEGKLNAIKKMCIRDSSCIKPTLAAGCERDKINVQMWRCLVCVQVSREHL